jgi:hypothetical protein
MLGSANGMIEWINRRESHFCWWVRRFLEECEAIRPTLLKELMACVWSMEDLRFAIRATGRLVGAGFDGSGGEPFATFASICERAVDLRLRRRAIGR